MMWPRLARVKPVAAPSVGALEKTSIKVAGCDCVGVSSRRERVRRVSSFVLRGGGALFNRISMFSFCSIFLKDARQISEGVERGFRLDREGLSLR